MDESSLPLGPFGAISIIARKEQQGLLSKWSNHAHAIGSKTFVYCIGTTTIRNCFSQFQTIGRCKLCIYQPLASPIITQVAKTNVITIFAGQGYPQGITCTSALHPAGYRWQRAKHLQQSHWTHTNPEADKGTQFTRFC